MEYSTVVKAPKRNHYYSLNKAVSLKNLMSNMPLGNIQSLNVSNDKKLKKTKQEIARSRKTASIQSWKEFRNKVFLGESSDDYCLKLNSTKLGLREISRDKSAEKVQK